ncbi:hypothetical protein T440DRAFT_468047 [Plenodomus tracheiphilus IPT5]|uniref:Uncharacterized protein n=1 Tax=Plenodomus tracheiphilus IPT5 TaxID=1408161 RepID=A0A6A7B810_9PLEO|nr:hypothetical protein T440DRAFT_468047 [Plenodomus tracheiphilus IPT5]
MVFPCLFTPCILLLPRLVIASPIENSYNPEGKRSSIVHTAAEDGWSKEAILALVGVITAIACFLIGLAWPYIRSFGCETAKYDCDNEITHMTRRDILAHAEEVKRYSKRLEFNAWKERRAGSMD